MPSLINKNLTMDENNAVVALVRDAENKDSEECFLFVEQQSAKSQITYTCYKLQLDKKGKGVEAIIINQKDCHELLAIKVFNNDMLQGNPLRAISWQISEFNLCELQAEIRQASQFPENIPLLPKENPGFFWCCSMLHSLKVPHITNTLPKNPEELHEYINIAARKPTPELGTDEPKTDEPKTGVCSLM